MANQKYVMLVLAGFAMLSQGVYAQDIGVIIEWAPFEVRQGVSDEELVLASESLQNEFLVKQKGYIKRELLKGKGNEWVDLVYWVNQEDADTASQNAMSCAVCSIFFALMESMSDPEQIMDPAEGIFHYKKIAGWD